MPHSPDGNNPASETNGVEETLPENPAIRKSLAAMLTPYIARKLGNASPAEVCCTVGYKTLTYRNRDIKLSSTLCVVHLGLEAAEL